MSSIDQVINQVVPVPKESIDNPYTTTETLYQVHNRYWRIGFLVACFAIVAMAVVGWKLAAAIQGIEPLVVRINESGEATVAPYASLQYSVHEAEIQFLVMNFTKDHYSRRRATAMEAFERKLFFVDKTLSDSLMEEERRTKSIQTFLSGADDEIEVYVKSVSIEDLRKAPYKARVAFDKTYLGMDRREKKRETYIAHFEVVVLDKIPHSFVEVNPLGLVISYFRQDQSF